MQRLSSAVNQTGLLTPSTKEESPSAQGPHFCPVGNTTMNPVTTEIWLVASQLPRDISSLSYPRFDTTKQNQSHFFQVMVVW